MYNGRKEDIMNRFMKLRLDNHLSQQELAELLGVSQQTICKYDRGVNEPGIASLKKLADIYNTTVDYIIGYDSGDKTDGRNLLIENKPLTEKEIEHLKGYRELTEKWQDNVDLIINDLNNN